MERAKRNVKPADIDIMLALKQRGATNETIAKSLGFSVYCVYKILGNDKLTYAESVTHIYKYKEQLIQKREYNAERRARLYAAEHKHAKPEETPAQPDETPAHDDVNNAVKCIDNVIAALQNLRTALEVLPANV